MNRILGLGVAALIMLSCSGGKNGADDRVFGSLSASFSSEASVSDSSDAVLGSDSVIVEKGIDGGTIDGIGKAGNRTEESDGSGKGAPPPPAGKDVPPTSQPPAAGKAPAIPDDLKAKLAKCYPQWDKGAAGTSYDLRQVNVDVDKLKASSIQLTGDKPEVVFVNVASNSKISKVKLSLENAKGLYCLDISADKGIENLDIDYICGSKLGLVDIEAGKAKKVNIKEFCPKP